ncbi:hypothetical protein L7F22_024855 [Adiantum nelumboides]|nr:hypothetical protein [Adiantum nelumboides]
MEPFNIGRSASTDDGGPLLSRGRSTAATPSWRRRFPVVREDSKLDGQDDADELGVNSDFDPVNLLDVGMRGWRDRAASLQGLHKSRSVAATSTLQDGLFKLPRNVSVRLALPPVSMMDRVLTKERRWAQELEARSGGAKLTLPDEYYASLAVAPHASLIFLVMLYHQALSSHGLHEEAKKIASLLEGIREAEAAEAAAELQGMDLLLKDGLLELYIRIQPYLPFVPSQIVKFKSLEYTANVFVTDEAYETFLTKALGLIRGPIAKKKGPRRIRMLKDVTGYLMPGTLTLVLGPPASGKSGLQYALSGKLHAGASLEGTVTYNDAPLRNLPTHRLAAAVGQSNDHLALLTVRETLEFARKCLLAFKPEDYRPELKEILGDALKRGQDPKLEITMSMMGLKHVANRIAGNAMTPGISEDEKYRLTAAEMFSGAHAVYFFDQLNTVAEDSITFDLLTAVRIYTRVRQITFLASLLQPSSEVFDLFDRVILLSEGQLVYQGPRQDALPYFENIGYKKPKHLSTGEFLQEVTTADGAEYLQPGFRKLTVEDFVIAYKSSSLYRDVLRIVNGPELVQELWVQGVPPLGVEFDEYRHFKDNGVETSSHVVSGVTDVYGSLVSVSMDQTTGVQRGDKVVAFASKTGQLEYIDTFDSTRQFQEDLSGAIANGTEPVRLQLERPFTETTREPSDRFQKDYVLSIKEEIFLLIKREINVTWRGKFGLKLRVFQVLVLSFFVGFLLFRVKPNADQSNMNLFKTAFFVSVMNMTMFNVGQLPGLMSERSIFYKQKGVHFFRPISYLLGKFIGSMPFSLCEATIWTFIVYFLTGMSLADGGWHFFVYYAVIVLTVLNGSSMVRTLSFTARDIDRAVLYIGVLVTLMFTFAGFLMARFQVPHYWIWCFYINPMQWAITALVINEYNSGTYSMLCKDIPVPLNLPQCNGRGEQTTGHAFLARGQFLTGNGWIAVSIFMLFAWLVLWNILTYVALTRIQHTRIMRAGKLCKEERKTNVGSFHAEDVVLAVKKLSHVALPVTLSWHELSYDEIIPVINRPRTFLSSVSGWGEPSDMVAFLGSEAGGNTALLNCLAGRKVQSERIGGQILVNSFPKVQKNFRHVLGYVDKIDAYTPYLTVRETVAYSAALRLGKSFSKLKQDYFVDEVLELTELRHLQDTLVVSLTNDVTFDQEKRLAIATELVANPSVLFLDNPTKGLDSSSATSIIRCLQQVAKTGRLVVLTLNYPSQRILSMFTKVQILKAGGETVYFGPVGTNGDLIRTYFEAIPGTPLCPPNKSVSAYAIGLVSDMPFRKSEKDYGFEYRVSELALRNHVHLQHLRRSKGQNGQKVQIRSYGASFLSVLNQTIMTVQRSYWRNVSYSWGRMIGYLITSIILGSVFYKLDERTTPGLNSRAGAIFISCVLVGMSNAQNAIPQVIQMRAVHLRERAIHQSNILVYNIAYTLAEIPYLMVANLIFCSIFLPMSNIAMQSGAHVFKFWFLSLEFYAAVTFFGTFLAVVSPMPAIASVLVPIVVGMWISTSGLVIPRSKILNTFIWVFWTNPLQYALHGLFSVAFYCDLDQPLCLNSGANQACERTPNACPNCDCPRMTDTGSNIFVWRQISNTRSLDNSRVPYDMVALLLFAILFRILTLLAFKYTRHYRKT